MKPAVVLGAGIGDVEAAIELRMSLKDIAKVHGVSVTVDEVAAVTGADRSFALKEQGARTDFDFLVLALGAHKMARKGKEHVLSICGAPEESLSVK